MGYKNTKRGKTMNENLVKVLFFIGVIVALGIIIYPTVVEIQSMKIIEHSGFVTDKWIEGSMFLTFSNVDYILEINNEYTKEVSHFEYRNIEIGDIFYYKEYDHRDIK